MIYESGLVGAEKIEAVISGPSPGIAYLVFGIGGEENSISFPEERPLAVNVCLSFPFQN